MTAFRFPLALLALYLAACSEQPSETAIAEPTTKVASNDAHQSEPVRPPLPKIDSSVPAKPPVSTGNTNCKDIWGFLSDKDPAGRIVRAAPTPNGRELGRILAPLPNGAIGDWSATFKVLRIKNGWLEIQRAWFDGILVNGKKPPKMYSGRGWIAGGGVWIGLQSELGFAEPSHASPVLIDMRPDHGFSGARQGRFIACEGRWVLLDWLRWPSKDWPDEPMPAYRKEAVVSERPLVLRAWVTGICNSQETTCDGIDGNRTETSLLEGEPWRDAEWTKFN